MSEIENNLEKSYQITTKIVLIQVFSAIILMIVGWFVAGSVDNSVSQNGITALWILFFLAVISSIILGKVLFRWQRFTKTFTVLGMDGVLKSLQQNAIFLIGLGQFVALIGFLIATLTVNKIEILRTGAVALVIFWFYFPRKPIWKKLVHSFEKV